MPPRLAPGVLVNYCRWIRASCNPLAFLLASMVNPGREFRGLKVPQGMKPVMGCHHDLLISKMMLDMPQEERKSRMLSAAPTRTTLHSAASTPCAIKVASLSIPRPSSRRCRAQLSSKDEVPDRVRCSTAAGVSHPRSCAGRPPSGLRSHCWLRRWVLQSPRRQAAPERRCPSCTADQSLPAQWVHSLLEARGGCCTLPQ